MDMVKQLCKWGFPFTLTDLQMFVNHNLDKRGVLNRFKDNLPTHRFGMRFLGRHPELSLRKTTLIKRSRASVSMAEIEEFFA